MQRKAGNQNTASRRGAPTRLKVLQPDLADSFRKAKAALEDATRDINELRRRATRVGRGPT